MTARTLVSTLVATLACWLLVAGVAVAQPAQLQGKGLTIRQLTSGTPGNAMALVEADAPHDAEIGPNPKPDAFTMWIGDGAGKDLTVARNGGRGKPGITVMLVDESGSYKKAYFPALADPVIRALAGGVGANDNLALLLFSTTASPYPVRAGAAAFLPDLDNALKRPPGGDTNLLTGLTNAIDLAAKNGEPGLRDVVLFSDAGDETVITEAQWNEIKDKALAASVRIHAAISIERPKNIPVERYLDILNRLEGLTKGTGGVYDKSGDAQRASAALTGAQAAQRNWLVIESGLCGMKARAPASVRVEYVAKGTRKAWSGANELAASAWAPSAAVTCPALCTACSAWEECIGGTCAARSCAAGETCPGGATCLNGRCEKPCTEACATWQTCKGGACVAKACAADEQCGVDGTCKNGMCAAVPAQSFFAKNLVWILIGLALLLLGGGFLLLRKKPEPVVEPVPEPALAPAPAVEPAPRTADGPDLDALPEVHLEAIGGWPTQGERWRIYKRQLQVGGSKDPGDANDIVFDLPKISSRHAKFQLYPSGDLWLTDLGSANGTFLNGQKLTANQRVKVKPGDQIKLSKALTLKVVKPGFDSGLDEPSEEAPPAPESEEKAAEGDGDKKPKKKTVFDPGNR